MVKPYMTSYLRTWYLDALVAKAVCLGVSHDLGMKELYVALFVPSTLEHFSAVFQPCSSCELLMQQYLRENERFLC